MIAAALVEEIKRLLAENRLSQRKIAERLGISRGTVAAVAKGGRQEELWDLADRPAGPPERCPGCGGMVYMPCLACQARALKETHAPPQPPAAGPAWGIIADDGREPQGPPAPLDAALHC